MVGKTTPLTARRECPARDSFERAKTGINCVIVRFNASASGLAWS
jgi:hypothetical protein